MSKTRDKIIISPAIYIYVSWLFIVLVSSIFEGAGSADTAMRFIYFSTAGICVAFAIASILHLWISLSHVQKRLRQNGGSTTAPFIIKVAVPYFFGYLNEEKQCAWLSKMAERGWHIEKCATFLFFFTHKEPETLKFRRDFRKEKIGELADYFQIFKDSGWDYACSFGTRHFFYTHTKATDLYSDAPSKLAMKIALNEFIVKNFLILLAVFTLVLLGIAFLFSFGIVNESQFADHSKYIIIRSIYFGGFSIFVILIALFLFFLGLKIRRLKRQEGEA